MNKIMKKTLSLVLALVMVLTLAPMTVMAASSSMTGEFWADGDTNTVFFDGDEPYVYTWVPEKDGAYSFTFAETDWVCSILDPNSGYADFGSFNNSTGVFTYEFVAGVEYEITILNTSYTSDDINFTVVEGEAVGGPVVGGATHADSVDVTEGMVGTVAATGMTSEGFFYISGLDASKTYTLSAMVNDPMAGRAQLGLTPYYPNGEAAGETVYSQGMVSVEVTPSARGGMVFFAVSHTSFNDLAFDFVVEAVGEEGEDDVVADGSTPDGAIELLENPAFITIPSASMSYYKVTLEEGVAYTLSLYNRTGADFDLYMFNPRLGDYGYYASADNGILDAVITAESTEFVFGIANPGDLEVAVQVSCVAEGGEDEEDENANSYSNPEVITETGEFTLTGAEDVSYWVQWNASAAGVFTVTAVTEGAMLGVDSVNGSYEYVYAGNDVTTSVQVVEGDEVLFYVYPGNGTITIDFEAGAVLETEDDNEEVATGEEIKEGYFYMYDELILGTNSLMPMDGYDVTLYEFEPATTGAYTFTVSEGVVGYFGSNVWFPYNDKELTSSVTVNYTEVGAPIVLGLSDSMLPMLTITRAEAQEEAKTPEYSWSVSSEAYVFTGNKEDLVYVDVQDAKVDVVYSVSDGFYHLNSADGPIVLVNLLDDILALGKATATGKVAITVDRNNDGKIDYIENWNEALDTYMGDADPATGLYPLTAPLMYIYQEYGKQQQWYTETGFVGSQFPGFNAEDIWMFACMYVPNAEDGSIVVPPVVVDPEDVTNKVIEKDTLEDIIKDAVANNRPLVIPTTQEGVTIEFAVEDLKDAEAVALNIEVVLNADVKDETVAKNDKVTADNFVLKVEFSHSGKLPANATITIPVGTELVGKTLYYHQILADGTLDYVCDAKVDADGNVKVTQAHCSDYVLLTEKIVTESSDNTPGGTTPDSTTPDNTNKVPDAPKTGDSTNFVLWFAILGLGVVAVAGSIVMKKRQF